MAGAAKTDTRGGAPTASAPRGAKLQMLSGWGRYPRAEAAVFRPENLSEVGESLRQGKPALARGAGRAYGDAALNGGGYVLDIQRLNRMLSFDPSTGVLRCEAGVTIADLIATFVRRGFFPPVTPGTKFVTLGGSLAADVHGKNHHRDSSLASHVPSLDLMLASGEIKRCSRASDPDLFWATVGGMGLTGIIVELELKLQPIESAYLLTESIPARDIDQAIEIFENADRKYQYSVAWFDCLKTGANLGRSVINLGNFARADDLDSSRRQDPLAPRPAVKPWVPFDLPNFALTPLTVRAFNSIIPLLLRKRRGLSSYDSFFYPLDAISNWNRIYGRRGFVQYQCVWPVAESRGGLVEVLEAIARSRRASFLTVLKKFGAQEGLLSFPMPGYTLALDFPVSDGLFEFLDRLDAMVMEREGRVYLAKDARLSPDAFRQMYPGFARWREIKASFDPAWTFSSTLSRRLRMDSA